MTPSPRQRQHLWIVNASGGCLGITDTRNIENICTSLNVYLTRDRNVTLRKPIKMNTGILDLDMKGMVVQYNKYVKNRGYSRV